MFEKVRILERLLEKQQNPMRTLTLIILLVSFFWPADGGDKTFLAELVEDGLPPFQENYKKI